MLRRLFLCAARRECGGHRRAGQQVIRLDPQGRTIDFKMNRKCAAGTGTFIEEIAIKTAIPLDKLDELARKSQIK